MRHVWAFTVAFSAALFIAMAVLRGMQGNGDIAAIHTFVGVFNGLTLIYLKDR